MKLTAVWARPVQIDQRPDSQPSTRYEDSGLRSSRLWPMPAGPRARPQLSASARSPGIGVAVLTSRGQTLDWCLHARWTEAGKKSLMGAKRNARSCGTVTASFNPRPATTSGQRDFGNLNDWMDGEHKYNVTKSCRLGWTLTVLTARRSPRASRKPRMRTKKR